MAGRLAIPALAGLLVGIVFGGLSEFWKTIFLSPLNTIPKNGMSEFWKRAVQLFY